MRKYRRKKPGLPNSKLSEEHFQSLVVGFLMSDPPSQMARELGLPPQTVRLAHEKIRVALFRKSPTFYYAALTLLEGHWGPEISLLGLRRLTVPGRVTPEEWAAAHKCLYSCPASLPPKRLLKAHKLAQEKPQPTLLNPDENPKLKPEPHGRYRCRSCVSDRLRANLEPQFIDAVAMELADLRSVTEENFDTYFIQYGYTLVLREYAYEQFEHAVHDGKSHGEARDIGDRHFFHIIGQVAGLAIQVIHGRQLAWHDAGDGPDGLESLY